MLTFNFNLGKLANLPAAEDKMIHGLPSLMQQVGVYVLQEQKFNFEKKSRGGAGEDGVTWKPLTAETELKKARKGKGFQKQRAKAKKLMGQLRTATTSEKRKSLLGKIQKARAIPKSQIGVDTGLLRNSVTPGYAGPDGQGGNVLTVNGNRVTVGYGRSYAKWFDAVRPLLPNADQLPTAWQQGIDEIAQQWVDEIAKELGLSR